MQFRRLSGAQQVQINGASLATVNSSNSSPWRSLQYFICYMGIMKETTSQDIGRIHEIIHIEAFIKVPNWQGGGAQRCPLADSSPF